MMEDLCDKNWWNVKHSSQEQTDAKEQRLIQTHSSLFLEWYVLQTDDDPHWQVPRNETGETVGYLTQNSGHWWILVVRELPFIVNHSISVDTY